MGCGSASSPHQQGLISSSWGLETMLRVPFTSEDIARIRLAPRFDPLWELILAVHMLRRQPGDLLFHPWRRQVRDALHRTGLGERLNLLLALIPPLGYFPDFLTPIDALNG